MRDLLKINIIGIAFALCSCSSVTSSSEITQSSKDNYQNEKSIQESVKETSVNETISIDEKNVNYSVYDISMLDGGLIDHDIKCAELLNDSYSCGEIEDENAPREVDIEYDGVTYHGVYEGSLYKDGDFNYRNIYSYDNGEFDIDSKTGKLVMLSKYADNTSVKVFSSKEECEARAKEIASKHIDISQYEMECKTNENFPDSYEFLWRIKVGEIYSKYYFRVTVAENGAESFVDYSAAYFEAFLDRTNKDEFQKTVRQLSVEKADGLVLDKLKDLYSSVEESQWSTVNYNIVKKEITLFKGDKVGIVYSCDVLINTHYVDGDETECEPVEMLLIIE